MTKHLEFETYNATVKDKDGDNQTSSIRAAVVTEDLAGTEVLATDGRNVTLNKGDAVVQTTNPDRYDIFTADQWKDAKYSQKSESTASGPAKKATTSGSPS